MGKIREKYAVALGFLRGFFGAVSGGLFGKNPYARVIGAAIVGGTISVATGGKFANGAVTAGFAAALRSDWSELRHSKIANVNNGKTKSHLSKEVQLEADAALNKASSELSFKFKSSREELVLSIDKAAMTISTDYRIEVGFHIYEIDGLGFFASPLHTSYLSGRIYSSRFLISGWNQNLTGGYHTHGGSNSGIYGDEFFSTRDINFGAVMSARNGNNNDYQEYLSTPAGSLKVFNAARFNQAGINTIRQINHHDFTRTIRK